MTTVQRPNKDALVKGCDIYRDAMRPFLLHVLRRVRGSNLQTTIRYSLPDRQRDFFDASLSRNNDVAGAIDIGMFPYLIRANWRDVFFDEFRRDNSVCDLVWLVKDARNRVSHPGLNDLDDEYTRARLSDIADVLGRINAPDEKKAVESIRDSRWDNSPTYRSVGHQRSSATAVSGDVEERTVSRHPEGTEALQQYVIYVDDPTNRSRIHKIDCRWYVNRKEETLSNNYWLHGPYILEKASDTERSVGKKDNGFCGTCIR